MTTPTRVDDPFEDAEVEQVQLTVNPLALALVQVRFPGAVSALQDALESRVLVRALSDIYPYAEPQDTFELILQPGRPPEPHRTPQQAWKLSDATGKWFVTLALDSISIHTVSYTSRSDFLGAVDRVLKIVEQTVKIPSYSRLGLRYTNRIESMARIDELVPHLAPGVRGILAVTTADALQHSMSELVYRWPASHDHLLARWGLLPPGATLDPAMPPGVDRSWVLDIDTYRESVGEFRTDDIAQTLSVLSKRAYRFFRWSILPDGLRVFGVEDDNVVT